MRGITIPGQVDESALAYSIRYEDGLTQLRKAGITEDHFEDEFKAVWYYLCKMHRKYGEIPGKSIVLQRFPDLGLPNVRRKDASFIISNLLERQRWVTFMHAVEKAVINNRGWDHVDEMVTELQGDLNKLQQHNRNGKGSKPSVIDMFSATNRDQIVKAVKSRRLETYQSIPTGLKRFDTEVGGLQRQRMVTVIGRPGKGKSWLSLWLVAHAVQAGHNVLLYPLEMSPEETAFRLVSIFSNITTKGRRLFHNSDLSLGRINTKRLRKFLEKMGEMFEGRLLLADTANSMDSYTVERIESEVSFHKPDMFWVDYLTLMKSSVRGGESWQQVGELSKGIKSIAMRYNVVGGCSAQVNRGAIIGNKQEIKQKAFLPRLENIAYGDSIGQDADQVVSLDRIGKYLFWALVKNRNGPEIPRTKMVFLVNQGMLIESGTQDEEEE